MKILYRHRLTPGNTGATYFSRDVPNEEQCWWYTKEGRVLICHSLWRT